MPQKQLPLAQWLPYKEDRNARHGGRSFYFFDLDDNILQMDTKIFLFHKETNEEIEISSAELAQNMKSIGKQGKYADYYIHRNDAIGSYRNFQDRRILPWDSRKNAKQAIEHDLNSALEKPEWEWHGPSWNHFFYAVLNGRPVSIITARGHNPRTIKRALNILYEKRFLHRKPNILTIYPVSNPKVRRKLGDPGLNKAIALLKKEALLKSVEIAFKKYGKNPHHRFGVSDDDPLNIKEITATLVEIKKKYPQNAFFVIDTSEGKVQKTEIFEDHLIHSEKIELVDALNYRLFDF
ncbi:hypothetical protein EXM22_13360 [Oceanispirochaeta crateris]|uniref:Uncharacterized protein n=1 Tax=Oceanispirochaeta crateris TaxID=2518645 RepID=A0A5C1QMN7_9SPIO|nr:hypothetical protein [Oceanispirochaeta crateris]QEN08931.1 hypothetical protein EXM22_13360 [Oceanispirochaeta crateris]